LLVVVVVFLVYSLLPYLTGGTRVPATFGWHYPLLVAHVMFGSLAMATAVLQFWPALRARPVLHRRIGRVYVCSALPSAGFALVIGAATPFGPMLAVSNVALALLWGWFTIHGYRAARRRSFAEHRRHMVRSAALALSVITNRVWTPVLILGLDPLKDNVFGGDEERYLQFAAGLGGWLGWVIPLAAVQWWLTHRPVTSSAVPPLTDTRAV
jgi:hypothetical protein